MELLTAQGNKITVFLTFSFPHSFLPSLFLPSFWTTPPRQWRLHGCQTSYSSAEGSQDEYPKKNREKVHVCFYLPVKLHSITSATLNAGSSIRGGDVYASFWRECQGICECLRRITKMLSLTALCAWTPFLFLVFPSILLPGIWILPFWTTRLRSGPAEQKGGGGLGHCGPLHSPLPLTWNLTSGFSKKMLFLSFLLLTAKPNPHWLVRSAGLGCKN